MIVAETVSWNFAQAFLFKLDKKNIQITNDDIRLLFS